MTDAPDLNPIPIPADEWQALWQAQPLEVSPMFLADVHKRVVAFERLQRWSLISMASVAILSIVTAAFVMLRFGDGLLSVGYFLTALGVLFAFYYRHNRNPANPQALAGASQACLDFYKAILKRRIRLARTAWAWAMLPVLPGAIIVLYRANHIIAARQPHLPLLSSKVVLLGGVLVVALGVRFFMQQGRARRLTCELEAIDAKPAGQ